MEPVGESQRGEGEGEGGEREREREGEGERGREGERVRGREIIRVHLGFHKVDTHLANQVSCGDFPIRDETREALKLRRHVVA